MNNTYCWMKVTRRSARGEDVEYLWKAWREKIALDRADPPRLQRISRSILMIPQYLGRRDSVQYLLEVVQ